MKRTERSYPHPVVGNGDDVPGAGFQATISAVTDKVNFYIDVQVRCGSEEIRSLVKQKRVAYVVHIECSNTVYRDVWRFHEEEHRVVIPASRLFDRFEVNLFACALKNISAYTLLGAHKDYGNTTFELREGDIIAAAEGEEFAVEAEDALACIGSIMVIEESAKDEDGPMCIKYDEARIGIILSKHDFATYNLLKGNDLISKVLVSAIVLPVLVQALNYMKEEGADRELNDLRWKDNIRRRLDKMGVKDEFDPLDVAQQLLESPVRRTLMSARDLAEGGM